MRLADVQATIHERGRIRIGYSTPGRNGQKVPHKLKHFRFTASHRETLEPVADAYGGDVKPWPEADARNRWQVLTEADRLPVIYPVGMGLSQSYDRYAKGFHTLACDGRLCHVPGTRASKPCECDPLARVCHVTTQLSLILPELPGLGVWRLVTHGDYATRELAGSVAFIEEAVRRPGVHVSATLELQERTIKRLVDGRPTTMEFVVPVLDTQVAPAELTAGHPSTHVLPNDRMSLPASPERALEAPVTPLAPETGPRWRPVDQAALAPAPEVPIAEVFAENDKPATRKRRRPQVGSSGVAPGDATCPLCSKPYGTDALTRNPSSEGGRFVHVACLETSTGAPDERGTDSDDVAVAEPTPSGAPPSLPMSFRQHNQLFALANEVLADLSDDERKTEMLAMAKAVGAGELTSRTQLTSKAASALIDRLRAVQEGRMAWVNGRFEDPL